MITHSTNGLLTTILSFFFLPPATNIDFSLYFNNFFVMRQVSASVEIGVKKHLNDGLSCRQIGRKMDISHSTVSRISKKMNSNGKKSKGGRPSKLSTRDKTFCVRQITIGNKENATEVKDSLQNDLGIDVSARTVCRVLREAGLVSFIKPKKPSLSPKNIKLRLEWAKAHVHWTIDDWKHVIWTDETKIERFGSSGKIYAWKRVSEQLKPNHVKQTVKHSPSLMVWSCITYDRGVGWMAKIDGKMNSELYIQILDEELAMTIADFNLNKSKMILMQDNDPKHKSRITMEYLEKQQYQLMEWPPQSPDLNPIENMWALLKKKLYSNYDRPPKGMLELWERVGETWYAMSIEECNKCIETMHKRCLDVIKNKGYWIDY